MCLQPATVCASPGASLQSLMAASLALLQIVLCFDLGRQLSIGFSSKNCTGNQGVILINFLTSDEFPLQCFGASLKV